MSKTYTVTKTSGRGSGTQYSGTIDELIEVFSYTIDVGASYNPSINRNPRTGRSLITALNKSVEEIQGGCYSQDFYELSK